LTPHALFEPYYSQLSLLLGGSRNRDIGQNSKIWTLKLPTWGKRKITIISSLVYGGDGKVPPWPLCRDPCVGESARSSGEGSGRAVADSAAKGRSRSEQEKPRPEPGL
jgi:hypothetical protein